MTSLDPVTLAVLQGRLEQLVDEMDATLFRSAFNPIIAEAHDASHGIYDRTTGATVAQGASGLPVFVGSMSGAVSLIIDRTAKEGGPREGDIWIFNDQMLASINSINIHTFCQTNNPLRNIDAIKEWPVTSVGS